MKTTLTILIAGLIFLVVPVIASAHDGYGGNRHESYKGWVKDDHRQHNNYKNKKAKIRQHKQKKHLKRELRETRRELRRVKRVVRQERRHHKRPYYVQSGMVFGLPNVVFRFDW